MDEKMMSKLMAKSAGQPEMSDMQKQAKLDVIMELLEMAKADMGVRVDGGLKELATQTEMAPASVTVQAETPEDLEEGLDMASELTEKTADEAPMAPTETEEELDNSDLARMMGAKRRI